MDDKYFGVMLDVSRNAVMKIDTVKQFIDCLAKMGYNALELYAEDTYEVEGEPYFGYMRGAYTKEELREIDAYCIARGIELIPCIQTLAHFTNLVRLPHYAGLVDCNDILLIDEPQTYELLEKIFAACADSFTSRRINIGMDEAMMVGLGRYLQRHGYCNRFDILNKHLGRVCELAAKYGFRPHMWSDMFFRLAQKGQYYSRDTKEAPVFDRHIIEAIPDNVELAYWDYYHTDEAFYDFMMTQHKKLERDIWFAGGAWVWEGFAPHNSFSLRSMEPAMRSCIKNGIDKVMITMWGDNGKECSSFAALPSLYAIRQFADGVFDMEQIKEGFLKLFGIPFDSFMTLDLPNCSKRAVEENIVQNTAKILLYQDPFMGIADDLIQTQGQPNYGAFANDIYAAAEGAGEFKYLFECLGDLCAVLDKKMMLGVDTRRLYQAADTDGLAALLPVYTEVGERIERFYKSFKTLWFRENKPFGWEIQDARLGGLIRRVASCRERLEQYLHGEVPSIPELSCEILNYNGDTYKNNVYTNIISRSCM